MDKLRTWMKNPLYVTIAAAVIGVLFGWMVLGWLVFPVTYTDTDPSSLRQDFKEDYAKMAVDSFIKTRNLDQAKARYNALGKNVTDILESIKTKGAVPAEVDTFRFSVNGIIAPPVATQPVGLPTAKPGATQAPAGGQVTAVPPADTGTSPLTLIFLCLVLLVLGAAIFYVLVLRGRKDVVLPNPFKQVMKQQPKQTSAFQETSPAGVETSIIQYMTTYKLGVDLYDDSFSIDSPTGEFLGECGVGIADTIGVGEPKKVSAFEVWLFDKNDIQTITKVMMSEHAFNDLNMKQKLATKGEPVMVGEGKIIMLETATLRLEARVLEMNYGTGALPANSYFDRMTLELSIWPKPKA
jgi:hypothetical protein